ncbi:hypothetical protein [uncultured Cellulomonas sp.]|uniref:hypothetical protein n=1 Tax=uncultured Cellulomonas sp. TaxID=189682 RepID=UPI0028E91B40|nr:hypothetical protein [uncultured Cellulomonas sp.]
MSATGKDPQWRDAERFAERHARTVLARTDVRVTGPGSAVDLDLVGADFAGRVEHRRSPVGRSDLEDLRAAAGTSVAVFYSRSGYTKTAVLWAHEHRVALFGYTDTGFAAPVNPWAVELVQRAQVESEHQVRVASEVVARPVTAARQEAQRREREALAQELRAEEDERRAAERRRVERVRSETLLARTVVLLLQLQVAPGALAELVDRLAHSTIVSAVADSADRLSTADRAHAVTLVRSQFDDAAAALEVLTPATDRGTANYRTSRQVVDRGLDALDAADGAGVTGHMSPDQVAARLRQAERCWRALVGELTKALPPPVLGTVPAPRRPRHLTSSRTV